MVSVIRGPQWVRPTNSFMHARKGPRFLSIAPSCHFEIKTITPLTTPTCSLMYLLIIISSKIKTRKKKYRKESSATCKRMGQQNDKKDAIKGISWGEQISEATHLPLVSDLPLAFSSSHWVCSKAAMKKWTHQHHVAIRQKLCTKSCLQGSVQVALLRLITSYI